jgi:hypothetical protein
MTEMISINPETGEDSEGNVWDLHVAIAKELGGEDLYERYEYVHIPIELVESV